MITKKVHKVPLNLCYTILNVNVDNCLIGNEMTYILWIEIVVDEIYEYPIYNLIQFNFYKKKHFHFSST